MDKQGGWVGRIAVMILALLILIILILGFTGLLRSTGLKVADALGIDIVTTDEELDTYDASEFDKFVSNLDQCTAFDSCFCDFDIAAFSESITIAFENKPNLKTDVILFLGPNEIKRQEVDTHVAFMKGEEAIRLRTGLRGDLKNLGEYQTSLYLKPLDQKLEDLGTLLEGGITPSTVTDIKKSTNEIRGDIAVINIPIGSDEETEFVLERIKIAMDQIDQNADGDLSGEVAGLGEDITIEAQILPDFQGDSQSIKFKNGDPYLAIKDGDKWKKHTELHQNTPAFYASQSNSLTLIQNKKVNEDLFANIPKCS